MLQSALGADGMSVKALTPYLKGYWARIRERLLGGTYVSAARIRRVESTEASGRSVWR